MHHCDTPSVERAITTAAAELLRRMNRWDALDAIDAVLDAAGVLPPFSESDDAPCHRVSKAAHEAFIAHLTSAEAIEAALRHAIATTA